MRKISLDKIDSLLSAIGELMPLYIPSDTDKGSEYKLWESGMSLSTSLNTVRSPKEFFFPQSEDLMKLKLTGKKIEIEDTRRECEDFAVFGVRACDVKSFDILDKVFLSEPLDSYYKNRRDHGVIFSLACSRPAENCFCTVFGIDPAAPRGDVECIISDGFLFLEGISEKGKNLLSRLDHITCSADPADTEKERAEIREKLNRLPLRDLPIGKFGKGKTDKFFSSHSWDELSATCLGCGSCTFVCPTCQCYDIKDFDTGHGVIRYRCWDSCMYSDFTKMSHGNPRNSQKERYRQRFMHKLVYFPDNNDGEFSCVGCGRCLRKCPVNTNIVKVIKKLGGNDDE